jgi:hypothetical protein
MTEYSICLDDRPITRRCPNHVQRRESTFPFVRLTENLVQDGSSSKGIGGRDTRHIQFGSYSRFSKICFSLAESPSI